MKKDLSVIRFIALCVVTLLSLGACGEKSSDNNSGNNDITTTNTPNFNCLTNGTNCQTFTTLNGINNFNGFDPAIVGKRNGYNWNNTYSGSSSNFQNGIRTCGAGQELVAYCPQPGVTQYTCLRSSSVTANNGGFILSWSFRSNNSRGARASRRANRRAHRNSRRRRNRTNVSIVANNITHSHYRNHSGTGQQSIAQICTHSNQCNYVRNGSRAYCNNGNNSSRTGVCVSDDWFSRR